MTFVPYSLCNSILRIASKREIDQREIWMSLGFINNDYYQKTGSVPLNKYLSIIDNAEKSDLDILSVYSSQSMLDGGFYLLPNTFSQCLNSKSLYDAIKFFTSRNNIYNNMMEQEVLVHSESEIEIKCEVYHSALKTSTYLPMGSFLIIRDLVKYYTPDENVDVDIKLIGGKNTYQENKMIKNVDLKCMLGHKENVMKIKCDKLFKPFHDFNSNMQKIMNPESLDQGFILHKTNNTTEQITKIIQDYYHEKKQDKIDIIEISKQIGLPTWTLKRKLASEGVSFSYIQQKTKYDIACLYLKSTNMTIDMISDTLGFSSQSSFSRFFKELSGITPLLFRKQ